MIDRLIGIIRKTGRNMDSHAARLPGMVLLPFMLAILFTLTSACDIIPITSTTVTTPGATTAGPTNSAPATTAVTSGASAATSSETSSEPSGSLTESTSTTVPVTVAPSPTETSATPTSTPSTSTTAKTTTTKQTTTTRQTTTVKPTATHTPTPTTASTTATTTASTTATTASTTTAGSASFPYKNYGSFSRDEYGTNSSITTSPDGGISIDTGSAPYGVALVSVAASRIPLDKRCKVLAAANGSTYQYEIQKRDLFLGIPMQLGEGSYTLTVYEQVSGTSFTPVFAHTFDVNLASSLKPYTAASVMSDFSDGNSCVGKARSLCSGMDTATGRVDAIYQWIVANIDYDSALAGSITSGDLKVYLPDPETTYTTKKGICFDYASLMCAMLRCQGIPTRLIFGQTPIGYHAWNEVYFSGTGWVIVASFSWEYIEGSGWVMFDTTFAAGGMLPGDIQELTHTKQKTY